MPNANLPPSPLQAASASIVGILILPTEMLDPITIGLIVAPPATIVVH